MRGGKRQRKKNAKKALERMFSERANPPPATIARWFARAIAHMKRFGYLREPILLGHWTPKAPAALPASPRS